jgi:CheY-like chemotaxis protein
VIDNGQGIPPEDVEKIFEPFRRLSNGTKRVDGSGLGLYIVKSAIELLGGKVWHSDSPSGGAQFTFTLPESLAKGVVAPARPALDVRPAMPTPAPSNVAAPPKPAAAEPAKTVVDGCALVVEDSEIIREIMAAVLRQHFTKVIVAKHTPDIILTDLFMPNMAGDEMIAKLRPDFPTLPIIGVTAAVVGEEARRFEVAGADRVLAKPLRTENIADIVEQYFGAGPSRATRA